MIIVITPRSDYIEDKAMFIELQPVCINTVLLSNLKLQTLYTVS